MNNSGQGELSLPQILALKQIQKEMSNELDTKGGSIDTLNSPGKTIDNKD